MNKGLTYRDAGVDLDAAQGIKGALFELVRSTRTEFVSSDVGSFGGRFRSTEGRELVASTDGVGTKLKVAFLANRHDTVGADLVNHCVNDILVEGARPLVFLDYVACGTLEPDIVTDVVSGLARACRMNGCALLGGETAEMPDFYAPGEYDLAGFIVGEMAFPEVAARDLCPGDKILGIESSGIHTNGYSFVRELFFNRMNLKVTDPFPGSDATVGDVLLRTHQTYLSVLEPSLEAGSIRGLAHVTGGGISGNLNRILGETVDAVVYADTWELPHEFQVIADESGAEVEELFRIFNMGVGMLSIVRPKDVDKVLSSIKGAGCNVFECGELIEGEGNVRLEGL
jgi:phosphoribosylformylglycinamidine cyclo-ligase